MSHELSSMEYCQPIQQIILNTIHEHILSFGYLKTNVVNGTP